MSSVLLAVATTAPDASVTTPSVKPTRDPDFDRGVPLTRWQAALDGRLQVVEARHREPLAVLGPGSCHVAVFERRDPQSALASVPVSSVVITWGSTLVLRPSDDTGVLRDVGEVGGAQRSPTSSSAAAIGHGRPGSSAKGGGDADVMSAACQD